ncbi:MAG TPA: GlcNAc-PI de-N-acetylase [Anaerolinea thermolimosa]|uniref:GlcNAc-PI de-N-acetylase n=1 Tax=Anaerolinea thermolimosa TaxID=229919 RepID=A0A3D1JG94_9CHLR|nr:GlcNAc-PI de-N-acetylase [Anaerolinea thermolimosa]
MENHRRILLAVLAHPDDESFGTGGTLAYYARQGVEVHLVCATRGEAGEMEEGFLRGFTSPAERREAELRCAAEKLGLKGVYFLGYRDSGMPGSPDNAHPNALVAQPQTEVALKIACFIRLLRPQVVITFDPIGGYRHPDHIAVHRATVEAFSLAAQADVNLDDLPPYQAERLYFHLIPRTFLRWMVRLMPLFGRDPQRFGKNHDIDLRSIVEVHFPVHAVIQYRSVAAIRDAASACHASQGGSSLTGSGIIGRLRRLFFSYEMYMRGYPPARPKEQVVRDLFAGISGGD